jgi:hypothetical protein
MLLVESGLCVGGVWSEKGRGCEMLTGMNAGAVMVARFLVGRGNLFIFQKAPFTCHWKTNVFAAPGHICKYPNYT